MDKKRSTQNLLWLTVALVFPLTNIFWRPVPPNDYWWYLRLGAEIVNTRAVPVIESFSYTQAGQPMIYHSWLSAVFFWALNALGGINLTILVAALFIASAYALVWRMMVRNGLEARWASLLLILVEVASNQNWAMRPQLFAYPIFVLSLYLLWDWEQGRDKYLWALPLLTLIWVNLHGSFALVFLLAGAAFVFGKGDRKKMGLILALMFIAMLINPRGVGVSDYILNSLTNTSNQDYSVEWLPPVNEGFQANLFFASYLILMLLASISPRKLSLLAWSWLLGFGWLALSGSRYDIWYLFIFAVMSAALLAPMLKKKKPKKEQKENPAFNILVIVMLVLLSFLFFPSVRTAWMPAAPAALSEDTPVEAAAWIRAHPELRDPIWANLTFESYLVYALPERPVWIDTRFEVYPENHWDNYLAVSTARWNWEEILLENDIQTLLLSLDVQKDLITALNTSPNWERIYTDQISTIYLRREP